MEDAVSEAEILSRPPINTNTVGAGVAKESYGEESKREAQPEAEEDEQVGEEKRKGGILGQIISSLVSPRAGGSNSQDRGQGFGETQEAGNGREETGEAAVGAEGGVGSNLISNLFSHLAPSLPDDAAPTTDEASILIHAIVHD